MIQIPWWTRGEGWGYGGKMEVRILAHTSRIEVTKTYHVSGAAAIQRPYAPPVTFRPTYMTVTFVNDKLERVVLEGPKINKHTESKYPTKAEFQGPDLENLPPWCKPYLYWEEGP